LADAAAKESFPKSEELPTGMSITPTAARWITLRPLESLVA